MSLDSIVNRTESNMDKVINNEVRFVDKYIIIAAYEGSIQGTV